jgi:Zn-dependent protease/predicted transcriptional regulator
MFEGYRLKGTIKLGKAFGVPIRLHYTWFIAAVVIIIALTTALYGLLALWQDIILGIVAGLLFFASMSARALAQSFVAVGLHVPIKSITLYVFGGVPRITDKDTRPGPEVLIALAGPLCNLIIAVIFFAANYLLAGVEVFMAAEMMRWVAFFNVMMALFSLIPGFPLDGGRIFRTILWSAGRDYSRATRIAALSGRVLGFTLILAGILGVIIRGMWFAGLSVAVAGWFLENAAAASRRQALVREALHDVTARYMITQDYTSIKQQITFALIRDYIISSGQHCFLVLEEGKLLGIVTLGDIQIPQKRWDTTIAEIMTPASELKTAKPDQPAADLLEQMEDYDIDQIPVLDDGNVIGIVTRDRLARFLMARDVLKA